ncbi:hypothetical protein [Salinimicrobium flavum]|uniref:DUF4083 domain-containing protein n=1 Tax=Salinimicrobium flavum TaxID=1737065 RepID=A0ABW5IXB5_9FLAO
MEIFLLVLSFFLCMIAIVLLVRSRKSLRSTRQLIARETKTLERIKKAA